MYRFLGGARPDSPSAQLNLKCRGRDAYHGTQVSCPGILHLVNQKPAYSQPPFSTRKFLLWSAAIFASLLTIALLPICTRASGRQALHHTHWKHPLSIHKEIATSKAAKTRMSEDVKLGVIVLLTVLAIMVIGPVLAG